MNKNTLFKLKKAFEDDCKKINDKSQFTPCKVCGNPLKIYCKQTRCMDEPATIIYECSKCNTVKLK